MLSTWVRTWENQQLRRGSGLFKSFNHPFRGLTAGCSLSSCSGRFMSIVIENITHSFQNRRFYLFIFCKSPWSLLNETNTCWAAALPERLTRRKRRFFFILSNSKYREARSVFIQIAFHYIVTAVKIKCALFHKMSKLAEYSASIPILKIE